MEYQAIHHGAKMIAKKVNDRWMVGGDYDTNGALIMMPQTCKTISLITGEVSYSERWAWFELQGAVLKFQDYLSESELVEMGGDLAERYLDAATSEEEADPIKQLDTADEKPVRRKELERPYNKQTFYKYRGFSIRSQVQGCYSSNPYGSFDGWLRHPETGDKIATVSANTLKMCVAQADRFWANYNSAA